MPAEVQRSCDSSTPASPLICAMATRQVGTITCRSCNWLPLVSLLVQTRGPTRMTSRRR
jgi:hypothetical protein